ncbi:pyridoxal 5'-phosphate synthase glutaminase subunit PdxT [Pasteurellaceae bacterium USgator11]|nr:pyridoxal 5'-phosphate synthase glutaminase subunit PdxT [Pasteurellaceae bacterium UScroc12]TNG97428.1 pyridoxal 5'-phosphate synthase glutaminase subunit PdxT [Pasteurellaceae bacterium USgator41]TNG98908.1 pyridoxal 5'-phosphate synthase glutaminase subunit PdxT [Pasteurellaceae bacterium USgator11]TNG99655.1 pyridoxal 5'-phosphate synthase glutaminase subunit PdxT [Pasteurellaceae bacterium UScroc31]
MTDYSGCRIGVLALQGAVSEHMAQLAALGATAVAVKHVAQLEQLDGLILPGGESTAIGKLMRHYGFIEAIRQFAAEGKPLFGTCAGMILLAKAIEGDESAHLGLMDIQVRRNAFGRQKQSFQTALYINGLSTPFPAVFIRAPYISNLLSDNVQILAEVDGSPVLARQDNLLVCAFHPELSTDPRITALFLDGVRNRLEAQ